MYFLHINSNLSTYSDFSVAIAAIHWPVLAWLEWHFGLLATLSAYSREHLALRPVAIAIATVAVLLRFPCLAAF
jgi:hypothetical protein